MNDFSRFNSRLKEPRLPRATLVAWSLFALLAAFIAWASLFHLDEVTTGSGKVIPSSHEQVIQSLEGGIIHSLMVREGDIVERGQQLGALRSAARGESGQPREQTMRCDQGVTHEAHVVTRG